MTIELQEDKVIITEEIDLETYIARKRQELEVTSEQIRANSEQMVILQERQGNILEELESLIN